MEVVFWGAVHSECPLSVDVCVHAHIALGTHRCVRVAMGCLGKEGRDPLMHLSRCNAPSAGLTREPRQPPSDPGATLFLQTQRNAVLFLGEVGGGGLGSQRLVERRHPSFTRTQTPILFQGFCGGLVPSVEKW